MFLVFTVSLFFCRELCVIIIICCVCCVCCVCCMCCMCCMCCICSTYDLVSVLKAVSWRAIFGEKSFLFMSSCLILKIPVCFFLMILPFSCKMSTQNWIFENFLAAESKILNFLVFKNNFTSFVVALKDLAFLKVKSLQATKNLVTNVVIFLKKRNFLLPNIATLKKSIF